MDQDFGETVIKNAFQLWFNPEVEKRAAAGLVQIPYALQAAQVIFPPEGGYQVRLNSEVKGIGYARASRAVQKGDAVLQEDWDGLQSFDVCEEELDNGHFTILLIQDRWFCTFNFLRRRAYCGVLIKKAAEFLETAREAQRAQRNAPAVDNLFSATELISKAYLLLHSSIPPDAKTHGVIHSAINSHRRLNNIDSAFVDLFNSLSQLRQSARYNAGFDEKLYLTDDDFDLVAIVLDQQSKKCEIATPKTIPDAEIVAAMVS